MTKFRIPDKLLSTKNSKTIKGEKYGYTTYILYMSPYKDNSKGANLCPKATKGCAEACLFGSGAARFPAVQDGKRNKSEFFLHDLKGFMLKLYNEIAAIEQKHANMDGEVVYNVHGRVLRNKKFAIRLNGTTDIRYENIKVKDGKNIFELFPNVTFYDYTKIDKRFHEKLPENYYLTFSRSEENDKEVDEIAAMGYNVAVVFGSEEKGYLPETYLGLPVINGDESDLRFLDDKNVIVGLTYKYLTGKGTKGKNAKILNDGDFVINADELRDLKKTA